MIPDQSHIGKKLWNIGWEFDSYFYPERIEMAEALTGTGMKPALKIYGMTYSAHGGFNQSEYIIRDEWEIWDIKRNAEIKKQQKLWMRMGRSNIVRVIDGGRNDRHIKR